MRNWLFMLLSLLIVAPAQADVYLTPFAGYTAGGKVEDNHGVPYNIRASAGYGLTLEVPYETGRMGLFYATQNTKVEQLNEQVSMHYLQFQSSIYYPADDHLSSYLGLGIGASYADAEWVDKRYGFSASILAGLEYRVTPAISFNTQFRWLGTAVDSRSSTVCTQAGSSSCVIRFSSNWVNQFSANLGLTIRF